MLRVWAATALCVGILSGCSTTQNLVNKVSGKVSGSDTPLAQVLKERTDLHKELSTVEIRQYFNRTEQPTVAEVKVTETNLLDDSVTSIRTIYNFKLIDGAWKRLGSQKAYQCGRGKNTKTFQTAHCP